MARDPKGVGAWTKDQELRKELDRMWDTIERLKAGSATTILQVDEFDEGLEGEIIVDYNDLHKFKWYSGGQWRTFEGGGTGGNLLPRNLAELGGSGTSALGTTHTHTTQWEDVFGGDGILVVAMAPPVPSVGVPEGIPTSCTDSAGNTYTKIGDYEFHAATPVVNEGVHVSVFWRRFSGANIDVGGTVTVTWNNNVRDRTVVAFVVTRTQGTNDPTILAASPDNDTVTYATNQSLLTSSDYTPTRNNSLVVAWQVMVWPPLFSGAVYSHAFGGVSGYGVGNVVFNPAARGFTGAFNAYDLFTWVREADVYTQTGTLGTHSFALGAAPEGVAITGINTGQGYSAVQGGIFYPLPNTWKGAIILGID